MNDTLDELRSPARTRSPDVGDETARRYRYQYEYTASLACGLLLDNAEFDEVFCEHHEDILLKRRSGRFVGIQVKTRQPGSDPWKATDPDVLAAIAKFVQCDVDFPDHFDTFTLATNHQFFMGKKNGANLPHLLELARTASAPLVGALNAFAKKLVRSCGRAVEEVLRTLRKTSCDHHLPKFQNSISSVCEHVRVHCAAASEAAYHQLRTAAVALADDVSRAAALDNEQVLPLYLPLAAEPVRRQLDARIEGKRYTRDRVQRLLTAALRESPGLLAPADETKPAPLPDLNSKLGIKLDAGGLSATTIHAARDCWSSALKQQLDWNSKLGEERALERYGHLKALALNEAAAAYEATANDGGRFGRAMLDELRRRLRERRAAGDAPLFNSADEHLLGYVYMLTEECKVWWSAPFDIQEPA